MASLKELFTSGQMKVGDCIDYHPDVHVFKTNPEHTGWQEKETLRTKQKVKYILWGFDEKTGEVQITSTTSVNPITLSGIRGVLYGPEELHRLCKTNYSNAKLGAEARSFTLNDILQSNEVCSHEDRMAFYSEHTDIAEVHFNGKVYEVVEAHEKMRFYMADGGGITKKDEDGIEYRITQKDNPVFMTSSFRNVFLHFNDMFEEKTFYWLASGGKLLYSRMAYGDVRFYLRNVYDGYLSDAELYGSRPNSKCNVSCGVRPMISLNSELKVEEDTSIVSPSGEKTWKFVEI